MTARALKYRRSPGARLVDPTPPQGATDPALRQHREAAPSDLPKVRMGEVTSASEMRTDQSDDDIRREGLTGRQLRIARRVAAKHGIPATSDFDAVRQLRAKGIDPFKRENVLDLVQRPDTPMTPEEGRVQLPSTVPQAAPPAIPTPPDPAEQRASDILKIQRDIAKRRRRKLAMLMVRLFLFVFLPTAVAGYYYYNIATPLYATNSEFNIQQAESQAAGGLGGLFQGTGLATQQDSTTVQSYLQSRDAMQRLDAELGFQSHWTGPNIDALWRLEPDATNEATYALYQSKVRLGYDPTEGILKMEVIAADPQTSQAWSERLISYAEEQVDSMTQRLRNDQMQGARESFEEAERRVIDAQAKVLDLQERLGVLDPLTETSSLMSQITQFETQLRTKQLELDQVLANARPQQARVDTLRGEIGRLRDLVQELRSSMTDTVDGTASLARISGELRIAEADLATRQLLLQQAASQMESARVEANRQTRYITVGVSPIAPDEPTYPRAFENTLLAFAIFAGIYLMLSLTVSVLREQVSA